ncbi:cellulase-like family protein [Streptomyces sp. 303MFCol5.2]|uniref:cellulase-like family protein n=1 Tax=Streptomyces sp. 303MFCol5.2 TaxID=1172181 RepID=UPI0003620721|nr:cellulase-like family protein [Streptomyces sp. 303MFCol5.2]
MTAQQQPTPAETTGRLAITLWDFSWYTQAGPGEPFADIDRAFAETVERGFNTVRICAMPFLLFSGHVPDPESIQVRGLGEQFGQRTRWYDVRGGYPLDGRRRLVELFEAAARHDCKVIVSSWEYQQSPSFADTDTWHRALAEVPGPDRAEVAAEALADLLDFLTERDLADPVAYVEVHNEVDNCSLVPDDGTTAHYARLRGPLERAVKLLQARHPAIPVTYSLGEPWPGELDDLPEQAQIAHFHFYVYGVLGALYEAVGLGHGTEAAPDTATWPTPELAAMLRPDAPAFADYRPDEPWRLAATGIPRELFYAHDWVDPDRWDLWLYENYAAHRQAMRDTLAGWVDSVSEFARRRGVPAVLGEGVVGYTPLLTRFEEDAVGKDIAEFVVDRCLTAGFRGVVLTSNAAPHHPMWHTDGDWMRRVNSRITGG